MLQIVSACRKCYTWKKNWIIQAELKTYITYIMIHCITEQDVYSWFEMLGNDKIRIKFFYSSPICFISLRSVLVRQDIDKLSIFRHRTNWPSSSCVTHRESAHRHLTVNSTSLAVLNQYKYRVLEPVLGERKKESRHVITEPFLSFSLV